LLLAFAGAVLACGSAERDDSGRLISSGNLDVESMKVGDCFQSLHEDILTLDDVPAVPCSEPHDNEVFHIFSIDGQVWPGDEEVEVKAFNTCIDAFEVYIEVAWPESQLEFTWFSPTQRAWEQLDYRDIVCFVFGPSGQRLVGSVKGTSQ